MHSSTDRKENDCGCSYYSGIGAADTQLLEFSDPFSSKFHNGDESEFIDFPKGFVHQGVPDLNAGPFIRPSNFIGPTDEHSAYCPAMALSQKLQIIDVWNPNTDWGGGYTDRDGTYLMIGAQERPILEGPRYSYAAIDTEELLEEAERRVSQRFNYFDEGP